MFSKFLEFVNVAKSHEVYSANNFLVAFNGETFANGLYRIFDSKDLAKWTEIVRKAFPKFSQEIKLFGFDWLGRIFAVDLDDDTVLLFEPGTGEVIHIPVNLVDFHNEEMPQYPQDCLAINFFNDWYKANNNYVLKHNQCAGYEVPLFLNGKDTMENLEISDMEIYWEIMMPLMNM